MLLTIGFMILIFTKSSQSYQQQDLRPSLAVWIPLTTIQNWLPHWEFHYDHDFVTWQHPYDMLEFFIRKAGHVTEYAVLMFLWVKTLTSHSLSLISSQVNRSTVLAVCALLTLLYAASDEWHQSFVPGRTGHPIDIAIDAIGVCLILIFYILLPSRIKS